MALLNDLLAGVQEDRRIGRRTTFGVTDAIRRIVKQSRPTFGVQDAMRRMMERTKEEQRRRDMGVNKNRQLTLHDYLIRPDLFDRFA